MQGLLIETLRFVPAAVPLDTTGAAVTGDYVKLNFNDRICAIIMQGAWAGGTPAVTIKQATSAAAAGEKAVSFTEYWQGTALTVDVLARTAVVSDTFNLAATANLFTVVEWGAPDLDINGGFNWTRINIATPGSNADLIAVLYVVGKGAWMGKPSTMPTIIA